MNQRTYGQYCGFARAVERLGERWALLIVRDLLVSPKRFTDLHRGLPGIPTNVLTARLKELEHAGIVRRRILPRPERAVVYELTEYGSELDEIILGLGRWGARTLGEPREGEIVTVDSMITALRTTFRPEAAREVRASFELRMGPIVINAQVDDGTLTCASGPALAPDLIIEAGPELKGVMSGETSPGQAIKTGAVHLTGDPALLTTFAELFRI